MVFAAALQTESSKAQFRAYGFDSPDDVARVQSAEQFRRYLVKRNNANAGNSESLANALDNYGTNFRMAKMRAAEIELNARYNMMHANPTTKFLKSLPPPPSAQPNLAGADAAAVENSVEFTDPEKLYVDESSIQSVTSPAAYLVDVYNFANKIDLNKGPNGKADYYNYRTLKVRRPDLAEFELSYEHLNDVVPTLSLVNKRLATLLGTENAAAKGTEAYLAANKYPMTLPFHTNSAIVRESLNAMDGLSLSAISLRSDADAFGVGNTMYNLVPNALDRLGLYSHHRELLSQTKTVTSDVLYTDWYGLDSGIAATDANVSLQNSERFMSATGVTFDEYRQLMRDDVVVKDENGEELAEYKNMYARFLLAGYFADELAEDANYAGTYTTKNICTSPYGTEDVSLPDKVYTILNVCIRLQRRIGLPYFELDWLLTTALYSSGAGVTGGESHHLDVLADGPALNVLAHYVEWNARYNLTVDEFAAMLADINCYSRVGSTEQVSLMKKLFGSDAGEVTAKTRRYGDGERIKLAVLDKGTDEWGGILRRGLKVSKLEWVLVLNAVASDMVNGVLDHQLMGRIYRVIKLFRTLGWSVIQGMALIEQLNEKFDTSLKNNLCRSQDQQVVLCTMDRFVWLADWMSDYELSVAQVITIIDETATYSKPSQETINWVEQLKRSVESNQVTSTDFFSLTEWKLVNSEFRTARNNYFTTKSEYEAAEKEATVAAARYNDNDSDTNKKLEEDAKAAAQEAKDAYSAAKKKYRRMIRKYQPYRNVDGDILTGEALKDLGLETWDDVDISSAGNISDDDDDGDDDSDSDFDYLDEDFSRYVLVEEAEWLAGLERENILDSKGFVKLAAIDDEQKAATRDAQIKAAVIAVLDAKVKEAFAAATDSANTSTDWAYDSDDSTNVAHVDEIVERLKTKLTEQYSALTECFASQGDSLEADGVEYVLKWMGKTVYETISLLYNWDMTNDPTNNDALDFLHDLNRHVAVVDALEMQSAEMRWLVNNFNQLDENDTDGKLSLRQVYLLTRFQDMRNSKVSANLWYAYFSAVGDLTVEKSYKVLAALLDTRSDEIKKLVENVNDKVTTVEQADRMKRRLELCEEMGISVEQLKYVESANTDNPDWALASATASMALKRYKDGMFVTDTEGTVDEEKRDALVATYLEHIRTSDTIPQEVKDWVTSEETLYEYLLLDVNVSSKVPTTELLENIGAVQLYVNRIAESMSAEDVKAFDFETSSTQWTTMKEYRVWEAAKKLTLFPCNYVEPELRQDKTEIFKTLESSVSTQINESVVEQALYTYWKSVERLSGLKATGYFYSASGEKGNEDRVYTYHFTALVEWENNSYMYRTLKIDRDMLDKDPNAAAKSMTWTDWQSMDVSISSNDHFDMSPAFLNGRLYLMWFELEEVMVGKTKKVYLRPKAARRNLDGTFTQPWNVPINATSAQIADRTKYGGEPYMEQVDGAWVINTYGKTKNTYTDGTDTDEDNVVRLPDTLLPYLAEATGTESQRVVRYFSMPKVECYLFQGNYFLGPVTTQFKWTLTGSASDSGLRVDLVSARFRATPTLHRYSSVPQSGTATGAYVDDSADKVQYEIEEPNRPLVFNQTFAVADSKNKLEVSFQTSVNAVYNATGGSNTHRKLKYGFRFGDVTAKLKNSDDKDDLLAVRSIKVNRYVTGEDGSQMNRNKALFDADPASNSTTYTKYYAREKFPLDRVFSLDTTDAAAIGDDMLDLAAVLDLGATNNGAITFDIEVNVEKLVHTESKDKKTTIHKYAFADAAKATPNTRTASFSYGFDVGAPPYESWLYYRDSDKLQRFVLANDNRFGNAEKTDCYMLVSLYSTAIAAVATAAGNSANYVDVFSIANQKETETGVKNFLTVVENEYGKKFKTPKPGTTLDFYGPFGIYAWELFFYIPMLIASKYRQAGNYDEALSWLRLVYNPSNQTEGTNNEWMVLPLRNAELSFTEGNDPDKVSRASPTEYKLATVRFYLETLIEQGDSKYRLETTESLRLAKSIYATAESLFLHEADELVTTSTRSKWTDISLSSAASASASAKTSPFRYPLNGVVRDLYTKVRSRLYNLRHWLSISGEALNIPLIAPETSRVTSSVALLSSLPSLAGGASSSIVLSLNFDNVLARAKSAVQSLIAMGDRLSDALRRRDEQHVDELQATLDYYMAENYEVGGQISVLKLLDLEKIVLERDRDEADEYRQYYEDLSGETKNHFDDDGLYYLNAAIAYKSLSVTTAAIRGVMKNFPNIYGLATGGVRPEGSAEAIMTASDATADMYSMVADTKFARGDLLRTQREYEMEFKAAEWRVKSIDADLERIKKDIEEETGTLTVLREQSKQRKAMLNYQRKRSTNADFFNWYVARINSLYSQAFDVSLRFCRLVEQKLKDETGDQSATYVNPSFEHTYYGLLAGQSLMLDLQRMEFAHLHVGQRASANTSTAATSLSLAESGAVQLSALKATGRTMFTISDKYVDKLAPDEYNRRIKHVRVQLKGLDDCDVPVRAKLTLVSHRIFHDRHRSMQRASRTVYQRQKIALQGAHTDTEAMSADNGVLKPFERCGLQSTWALVFPSAIEAIKTKRPKFGDQMLLELLQDVVLHVTYTCRS